MRNDEEPDSIWQLEDFNIEGTTIGGFSELGEAKLEESKDLILPSINADGDLITEIKANAFKQKGITSVKIPDSVEIIGMAAFAQNELAEVELPKQLTDGMGNMVFAQNKLVSVKLNDGLELISTGAFMQNNLVSVEIPQSVTSIALRAFMNNRLEIVNIPSNINDIGTSAFENNNLTTVIVPKSIVVLGNKAFDKNQNIKLIYTALVEAIDRAENLDTEGKTAESIEALETAINVAQEINEKPYPALQEVNMAVLAIDNAIDALKNDEISEWKLEDFTFEGTTITGFSELGEEKFKSNKNLNLPLTNESGETITEIGEGAFMGSFNTMQDPNTGINSVDIPNTVITIGKDAFRYNALRSIDIPESVTTIKMSAFNGNKLQSLVIPNNVINLEPGTFTLNEISSLELPSSLKVIPTAFGFNKLTTVTIPEGVTKIDDLAFSDNQLVEINLPSTLEYLSGFNNNNIKTVQIPDSVKELGKKAFSRNDITSVTIPGNVKVIGEEAFRNTWHEKFLTEVTIEEGVEELGKSSFAGNQLKDVNIPATIKKIESNAFTSNTGYNGIVHLFTSQYENLNGLEGSKSHVINPARLTIKYIFEDKILKEVSIWESPTTGQYFHIGDKGVEITPQYNDNEYELEDVSPIKIDLNYKENELVLECKRKDSVEDVTIKSILPVPSLAVELGLSKEDVISRLSKKAYIIDSNDKMHEIDLNWDLEQYNGNKAGEYVAIGTFELPKGVIQSSLELVLEVETNILVKESIQYIDDESWEADDFTFDATIITGFSEKGILKLKSNKDLVLPKTNIDGNKITHIGKGAFKGIGLRSVIIPEGLKDLIIGASAFEENQIDTVYLPEGVKEIDTYAFYQNNIKYVDFPGTLKKIGNRAFAENQLISAVFSDNTKDIALDSFSFYKNQLTSVVLLNKVTKVHADAFRDNTGHANDENKVYIYTLSYDPDDSNNWFEKSKYHKVVVLDTNNI